LFGIQDPQRTSPVRLQSFIPHALLYTPLNGFYSKIVGRSFR
jgi:hypothetical protein